MSSVFDLMGTVTSVSADSGNVETPAIQGPVETSFRASKFYAFGVRCTGPLTELLDVGMQVKVRYIFGHPQSDIVAVWLGELPQCLTADSFYSREGHVVSVSDDHLLAKTSVCDEPILVSKDIVFCDGYRLKDTETEVNVGEVLMFDGVPIRTHSSEIQFLATCGWFGLNEPRILDRFQYFLSARSDEEYLEVDNVVGRVCVIPNDSVALVDVDAFNSGKVILTKQNFVPPCESLRFAISVGEELTMRLSFGRYCSDDEMWFAVAASKRCGSDVGLAIVERIRKQPRLPWYMPLEGQEVLTEQGMEVDQTAEDPLKEEPQEEEQNGLQDTDLPVLLLNMKTEVKCEINDDSDPLNEEPESPIISESEIIVPAGEIDVATEETPFPRVEEEMVCAFGHPLYEEPKPPIIPESEIIVPAGKIEVATEETPFPKVEEEMVCAFGHDTSQEHAPVESGEQERTTNGQDESDVEVLLETPTKRPRLEEVWVPCPVLLELDGEGPGVPVPELGDDATSSEDEENESSERARGKMDGAVFAKALAYIREEEAVEAAEEGSGRDPLFHFPETRAPGGRVRREAPFEKGPGTRTFLLDWSAVVAMDQGGIKFSALVGPDFGEVASEIDSVVMRAMNDNKAVSSKTLRANGNNVYFDAERSAEDDKFVVERIWFKQFSRPPPVLLLKPQLRYTGSTTFDAQQVYRGEIVSVPLHDCAIANVNDVPVLVRLDSLVTDRDYNQSYSTIDMYLKEGSSVLVNVVERRGQQTNSYFEAKKCWNEVFQILPRDHKVRNNRSWSDIWGSVDLFAKGTIIKKDRCVSISLSSSESVDATDCRFFSNGNLSSLSNHVGASITCHVTRVEGKPVVPHAFFGRRAFDHPFFAGRNLCVPPNLIDEKAYEGVVEDFPLVDFAVCRVGVLPVICYLSPVKTKPKNSLSKVKSPVKKTKQNSHLSSVVEKDLRVGQRVLLNLKQQTFRDSTFLVCATMIMNEYNDDKKVFVNFPGRVVKQPRPTGLIEANDGKMKVSFDLSCVRNPLGRMTVSSWAKKVRKMLREKNTSVHLTAKKGYSPEKPHTAYMVWIDNF